MPISAIEGFLKRHLEVVVELALPVQVSLLTIAHEVTRFAEIIAEVFDAIGQRLVSVAAVMMASDTCLIHTRHSGGAAR